MTERLIGIDAGTSMIKGVAFSTDGEPLYHSSRQNKILRPKSGWQEQDMYATWRATTEVLGEIMDKFDEDEEVAALGVTGQGDGCWLIDEDGEPAYDAILWSDGRADEIIDEWQSGFVGGRIYDICGSAQFPGSSLAILMWLRENESSVVDDADTVFFCKDWLKYKLTGTVTSDPSDMSLPYVDVEEVEYSSELFELVDAPELEELLPPLAEPTDVVGQVTAEAERETGVPEGTPVVSGLFDVPCSMYGSGVSEPGQGSSVVGTTSLNQLLLDAPDTSPHGAGMTLSLGLGGRWTRVMASMIGTPNLDWALEEIRGERDYRAAATEAQNVPLGAEGLLYHPYLSASGERAPFLNTDARAQFVGLGPDHRREHLIRAVYEGVALAMKDCYEHIPDTPDTVYVGGGGAKSEFWCEMFADCTGAEFVVPSGEEFGAKGAALLAGTGVGLYDDIESAIEETQSTERSYSPDPENADLYDDIYEWYKMTRENMTEVWEKRSGVVGSLERIERTVKW
ncbi:FGGY-family carbohydrate kinase [Halopelagius fulvigenes]|uniref:FGGY-family carbohydrate kinase n=1 Tax=Halopelagius fulvigenes TaxID=1198324 RepID=A0ABD5U2L4_9EURY